MFFTNICGAMEPGDSRNPHAYYVMKDWNVRRHFRMVQPPPQPVHVFSSSSSSSRSSTEVLYDTDHEPNEDFDSSDSAVPGSAERPIYVG
ncbi:hypothetical protein FRX31_019822 [Thalictrum thalictroides]|uniref:Uncharacterized protein n=1 Tax=Thalictrum thalictroides TaxID=46969 RepID=A0A7J6W255_THATH|nr:hypothetical protein FRX31_019822 [Thalictrum thalictroides]